MASISKKAQDRITAAVTAIEGLTGANQGDGYVTLPPGSGGGSGRRQPNRRDWKLLKIYATRTRGGAYGAYIWDLPATASISMTASSAITAAEMGVQGEEVHFINLAEITFNTHDLSTTDEFVIGFRSGFADPVAAPSVPKPIYLGFKLSTENCP